MMQLFQKKFDRFVRGHFPSKVIRDLFLQNFEKSTGIHRKDTKWSSKGYGQTLGSYSLYSIFHMYLTYLTEGETGRVTISLDDYYFNALVAFRSELSPGSVQIEGNYTSHILETGDADNTIFLPVMFEEPFKWGGACVGSIPAVIITLESVAQSLNFSLTDSIEKRKQWDVIVEMRNVARILYTFFKCSENTCVMYS